VKFSEVLFLKQNSEVSLHLLEVFQKTETISEVLILANYNKGNF
jgi:hypothetical protein